jgi:hypothetical protein
MVDYLIVNDRLKVRMLGRKIEVTNSSIIRFEDLSISTTEEIIVTLLSLL